MQNRIFFPQAALDRGISDGTLELQGSQLIVVAEGRSYQLVEALHIEREVTGAADTHEWVGRVKPRGALEDLGAEILETSMICGDFAYDVVPGWLGVPAGSFDDHVTSVERSKAYERQGVSLKEAPKTEEELLSRLSVKRPSL